MRPDDARSEGRSPKKPGKSPAWIMPAAVAVVCVAILGIGALAYLTLGRSNAPQAVGQPNPPAARTPATAPPPSEALVPDNIPFVTDRARATVRDAYVSAADHKALAISTAPVGFSTAQADDATAEAAALDMCQKRADALAQPRKCEIYAVGNTVIYAHARPPLPPTPWVTHDSSIASPLVVDRIPLMRDAGKEKVEQNYVPARAPKALALGPFGGFMFLSAQESADEAVRRALELCGNNAGVDRKSVV
jgi:hypothetical protein